MQRTISHVIKYEIEDQLFLRIRSERAGYYEMNDTFLTKPVIDAFPDMNLTEDATEAGNCFAVGRYTACVFHLMRILERCVQKMGTDLGVPEKITCEKEWQVVLNQIRHELKQKWPNEKDPTRVKYESIVSHLETVKIAWRNPTMHPKATYTDREAEVLIRQVQVFVEDFSKLS